MFSLQDSQGLSPPLPRTPLIDYDARVYRVYTKDVARGPKPAAIEMLFQIFRLNFS